MGIGRLPRAFWYLFAGALINRVGGFVMILIAFYLRNERHLAVEQAGFVVAAYGAGALAAAPLGGGLADAIGRKKTVVMSTVLGAAAMAHLGVARAYAHIAIAALLLGVVGEMYRPAMSAAVADIVPEGDRKRAYGLVYWAINVGFAIASILAGLLARVSFTVVFAVDAATTLVFGGIIALRLPETRPAGKNADAAERSRFPYGDGLFMAFVATSFVLVTVFSQGFAPLPLDMADHGITAAQFGLLLSINGILIVVLQPTMAGWITTWRSERALATAALLIGAGYGATAFARTPAAYALTIVLWTLGEIAMAPVAPAVVAELAPADRRGAYQGAYHLAWGGSAFLAPLVGSWMLGRFGSIGLWGACFVAAVIAAIGYLVLGAPIARRLGRGAPT